MINIRSLIKDIPVAIRLFLGRALLFFIVWQIVYSVFLYDSQYLDRILTTHAGEASALVLNNLGDLSGFEAKTENWIEEYSGKEIETQISAIYHNNRKVVYIAHACNGLILFVLYVGFVVCMPSPILRKILYIILGLIILDGINILRCIGLIYLHEYYYAYFDFAHQYLFKSAVYAATFVLWIIYARKINLNHDKAIQI
jgi:exosortase/archaeosortase family protein